VRFVSLDRPFCSDRSCSCLSASLARIHDVVLVQRGLWVSAGRFHDAPGQPLLRGEVEVDVQRRRRGRGAGWMGTAQAQCERGRDAVAAEGLSSVKGRRPANGDVRVSSGRATCHNDKQLRD
jgi:hypothetical protein